MSVRVPHGKARRLNQRRRGQSCSLASMAEYLRARRVPYSKKLQTMSQIEARRMWCSRSRSSGSDITR